jgi:hypothetical protein
VNRESRRRPRWHFADEVDRFLLQEQKSLTESGIDVRVRRSAADLPKVSVWLALDRLPHATAGLGVWETGEAELEAAWGQNALGWDDTLFEHHNFGSTEELRTTLGRLVGLVQASGRIK